MVETPAISCTLSLFLSFRIRRCFAGLIIRHPQKISELHFGGGKEHGSFHPCQRCRDEHWPWAKHRGPTKQRPLSQVRTTYNARKKTYLPEKKARSNADLAGKDTWRKEQCRYKNDSTESRHECFHIVRLSGMCKY